MNLPNKLTVLRTLLVPVFLVFMRIDAIPHNYLWAFIVFAVASFTDFLDGHIARARGLVTTFGKFLDPLADKVLVTCAVIAFVALDLCSPVAAVIIVARDYMVSAIRLVAVSSDGKVIAANIWGKIKTAMQMVVICGVLVAMHVAELGVMDTALVATCSLWLMWLLAAVTALSGYVYLKQNIHLINTFE